jgi:outer membrane protein TolC
LATWGLASLPATSGAQTPPAPPSDSPAPAPQASSSSTPSLARPSEAELPRVTLAQAFGRALERNVAYQVALREVTRAEALVRQARSSSFPTLIGTANYTRLDGDRTLTSGASTSVILTADQFSANVVLSVPLFAPQRWAQWSHAKTNVDVARFSAEDARRQLAVTGARAFLAVIAEKRVIEVDERALANAKAHYDYAHTRLAGGLGNRIDDVRADQEVATTKAQLENSYAGIARAREALGIIMGEEGPVDVVDEFVLPAGPSFEDGLTEALSHRSDVLLSQARLRAADQVRKDGYTDYLPFLVGSIQPFYQGSPTLTSPRTGWQASLLLTVPFYDGGLRYGLADERAALSDEARVEYEGMVRAARSDVRVAFEEVKRAEAALESANSAARLAKSALDLANIAYRAGATTNLEVIDAERRARDAETQAVQAEDAARQARLDLLVATGRIP